ncbi:MAG: SCO family protein [Psychroflexus sp.]|uniref:SCO family protein n=1 Tax=Psychroflexus sp. S27 TaxID=1982757 RepID=UPI000C2B3067|nr:SCO family protein [Psychroflexus sp. S27]PJX22676.1 SCO family protein [Psychroflexus sp. S27]
MKKYSYVGISLVVLIFGIWVVNEYNSRNESEELGYIIVNGEKKKVPNFELINQDKETITNADYKDKVYVIEFFFVNCPSICPVMTSNLVEVQNEFYGNMDFGIASITINPEFDTPEILKEYAEEYKIKHANWHLLTGDQNEIYNLSNKGFNIYAAEDENAPGGFEHSGYFALVDQEGYIRSRHDQFGNPIIFYRGSVPHDEQNPLEGEEPQIDILIKDIKSLLE